MIKIHATFAFHLRSFFSTEHNGQWYVSPTDSFAFVRDTNVTIERLLRASRISSKNCRRESDGRSVDKHEKYIPTEKKSGRVFFFFAPPYRRTRPFRAFRSPPPPSPPPRDENLYLPPPPPLPPSSCCMALAVSWLPPESRFAVSAARLSMTVMTRPDRLSWTRT